MTQLTEETFEKILQSFIRSDTIDLRDVTFIDPYGMVGLLEIGELCMLEDIKDHSASPLCRCSAIP